MNTVVLNKKVRNQVNDITCTLVFIFVYFSNRARDGINDWFSYTVGGDYTFCVHFLCILYAHLVHNLYLRVFFRHVQIMHKICTVVPKMYVHFEEQIIVTKVCIISVLIFVTVIDMSELKSLGLPVVSEECSTDAFLGQPIKVRLLM